jgi:hypothetical protein
VRKNLLTVEGTVNTTKVGYESAVCMYLDASIGYGMMGGVWSSGENEQKTTLFKLRRKGAHLLVDRKLIISSLICYP